MIIAKYGIIKTKALTSTIASPLVLSEPKSYKYALIIPEWKLAIQKEIDTFIANDTWKLIPLHLSIVAITYK